MIKTKKQMFLVIGAFTLVMLLVGTTYAFFNYTRTGGANVVRTGRIFFASDYTAINLTNAFPVDVSGGIPNNDNVGTITISVTGDTTYSKGLEYKVTAVDVQNTIGSAKTLPISINVTATSGLGTSNDDYFETAANGGRGGNTSYYKVLAGETITNDEDLLVGYIAPGQTGVDGNIVIKAYIDAAKVAISDTYDGNETDNMGTTMEWVGGRDVFTTTEWNAIHESGDGLSFKVKVESNEGLWVEEIRTVNSMRSFFDSNFLFAPVIVQQRENIKEIYFNKMGATRMQNAYEAATIKADLTYNNEGKVLAWLEENPDDNTMYNLIIASDGDTYFPENCKNMFDRAYPNLEKIEFNNINTSRVTNMEYMFYGTSVDSLDLSNFDTRNVTNMSNMFLEARNLTSLNLDGFNTNNVQQMNNMFKECIGLSELDLSSFSTQNLSVGSVVYMFGSCTELTRIYVSNTWDISNQPQYMPIFAGSNKLVGQAPNTTYSLTDYNTVDKTYAVIATDNTVGYLTNISLKSTN